MLIGTTYNADNLTTHAVITGMTGSGKTGLGVVILEELAKRATPALILDPKGDLTNLLLHDKQFNVDFTIYTPGSREGRPLNILTSLEAPHGLNDEARTERINSTVTAILGLAGIEADSIQSKEHILISNIFEYFWSRNKSLSMPEIIKNIQTPPFNTLGVFTLDQFYPKKERFNLAMMLNNLLASPSFQSWMVGDTFDIEQLLNGKHTIFYLSHLNDQERMFFVTLFYAAVEAWMRTQPGSDALRAAVYFDEMAGYIPPVRNPPSKTVILRLLKQARAFGLGLILATQNPIDIDYKALSNAGTWFIGKLHTEQDKRRLMEGLKQDFDIAGLGKREFLLYSVYTDPVTFKTRDTINKLVGPIERSKIAELNLKHGVAPLEIKPIIRDNIPQQAPVKTYYLQGLDEYAPTIHGQAIVYYKDFSRRVAINLTENNDLVTFEPGQVYDIDDLTTDAPRGTYAPLDIPLDNLKELEKRFVDWIYRTPIKVREYFGLLEIDDTFEEQCKKLAYEFTLKDVEKIKATYNNRLEVLNNKETALKHQLETAKGNLDIRREERNTEQALVFTAMLMGNRRSYSPTMKNRMIKQAKLKIEEIEQKIRLIQAQKKTLVFEGNQDIDAAKKKWNNSLTNDIKEVELFPYKKDIQIELFGLLWK